MSREAKQALDKMAENARELGLDYEHPTQRWKAYASDYERGVIDGMQKQMMRSVDKAVNAMAQRTWVGLTDEEFDDLRDNNLGISPLISAVEAKLKEKNT